MMFKNLVGLLFLIVLLSCTDSTDISKGQTSSIEKLPGGFYIENGPRQGFMFADSIGPQYTYRYITTTIINDSIAPMRLEIKLSETKNSVKDSLNSIVFILPRHLTPTRQQFDQYMSKELKWFLSRVTKTPVSLDTMLGPKQKCLMTFGILTEVKYPEPFGICLKGSSSNSSVTTLALSFDKYLIPCGQVSFINN